MARPTERKSGALFWLTSVVGGFLLIVSGCSSGRDFARPDPSQLVLGQTTIADITGKIGPPTSRQVRQNLNPAPVAERRDNPNPGFKPASVAGTIESLVYRYSVTSAPGIVVGPMKSSSRLLLLYFWNDRLIFYSFNSGFSADSTNFDEQKALSFIKGQTTLSDVIRELGRPSGEGIYPYVSAEGTRTLVYRYVSTESSGLLPTATESVTRYKTAQFLFDSSGRMMDSYNQTTFTGH